MPELDRKALKEAETVAKAIVSEYRPTMDRDVLASWAGDAVRCINDLLASLEEAEGRERRLREAINRVIPLLEDEGVGHLARPLIAARDRDLTDVLGAALKRVSEEEA